MRRASIGVLTLALMTPPAVTGCGGGQVTPAVATIQSEFDPHNFGPDSAVVTNRWMPWIPGTRIIHHGHFKGIPQVVDGYVTDQTRMIDGVSSRLVGDKDIDNGQLVEETSDFYAQDRQGNVWYFGEDASEFKHGHYVKASDSWEAGVNGAQPGIVMEAHPKKGDAYRQEYYAGHALDKGKVLGTAGPIKVPFRTFGTTLSTVETSGLEPGAAEKKYYAAGVGDVLERVVKGNHERFALVSVSH
jgi:hypothetical protein